MKSQQLQSPSSISFKQRIKFGDTQGNYLETNPMAYYLNQFYKVGDLNPIELASRLALTNQADYKLESFKDTAPFLLGFAKLFTEGK